LIPRLGLAGSNDSGEREQELAMAAAFGTYAFLHARLGALKTDFLSARQWDKLLAAESFADVLHELQSTSYAGRLKETPHETLDSLRSVVYRIARTIERSVPDAAARFIHLWARRDLLRNLKAILKGKALRLPEEQIRAQLIELDPLYPLPVDALLRASSLDAALDLLEATPLRRWIREARHIFEKDPSLFGLDAALDRLYYPELWRQMQRLNPADQASVRELILRELDQVNLLWLLRYRLNYHLSPPETYYLLAPVTGYIDDGQLKQMVREDSLEGVASRVRVDRVRRLLSECHAIWQVEVGMWRQRVRRARQVFRTAAFSLGEALAMLVIKIAEVRDLIAVVQGRELGTRRSEIEEQMILE